MSIAIYAIVAHTFSQAMLNGKIVRLSEQIMSADKYQNYVVHVLLTILFW